MQLYSLVETFDERARRCRTSDELSELLNVVVPDIGFQRYSLIHWLWFRSPRARLIDIDNYGAYGAEFVAREDHLHDPVRLVCQRASRAFGMVRHAEADYI